MKLNALFKNLLQNGVLGTTVANIHVVEWQKWGLPHGHILIILRIQNKPRDRSDYDLIVCAEFPNKSTDPELYNIVTSRMLHGPYGTLHPSCPYMVNGACNKGYLKTFQPQTEDSTSCYPTYRRQDLHPPHVSVVVGNLALDLLSCAPDHKCLCLSLPWKLISSRFLGVPNFTSSMMM
jgi:hypothetical protein